MSDDNIVSQSPQVVVTHLGSNWWMDLSAPALASPDIHVWEFPLEAPASTVAEAGEVLSPDEHQRAARFHFDRDARRFKIARSRMRSILGSYLERPPGELHFVYAQHGKPSIENPEKDIRFNLSHSGERAVLAVVQGREVGVDIEQIRENVEIDALAERFFSDGEKELLRLLARADKLRNFFRFWTCKEAFLKAQAVGLTRSLASFTVDLKSVPPRFSDTQEIHSEDSKWSLLELDCKPEYASALAVEGTIGSVKDFRHR
ncbi:MAG: 4'-phosphopantetheinyl transferase superfamily protein [Candidatus Sulfotelmatobacter sp.]